MILCPNARCEVPSILLAIVGSDDMVRYVTPNLGPTSISWRGLIWTVPPEKRFRFSEPSIEYHSRYWIITRCAVID